MWSITLDVVLIQFIWGGLVTMVGVICGVATAWINSKAKGLELRIEVLEKEHKDCIEERTSITAERDKLNEMLARDWPSDDSDFVKVVQQTKAALKAANLPFSVYDVAEIIRLRIKNVVSTSIAPAVVHRRQEKELEND